MAQDIMRAVLTGRLTADPELRELPGGGHVCTARVACNGRRKDNATGEWAEKPNFFTVKIFGGQGEHAARWGAKGRRVAVDGRLDWREWQPQEGSKQQTVEIIADSFRFLDSGRDHSEERSEEQAEPAPAPAADDDNPF